jgi:hypothetical protein
MKKVNLIFRKSLILILIFFSLFVKAQLGGGGLDENKPWDLSDFKPLTVEKFLETNFTFINRAYEKYPDILVKGYEIEIVPNKRPGFRPYINTYQIYGPLVDKAVLEWAIKNKYSVYRDYGYKIVKKLDNGTTVSVNVATGRWDPNPKISIEEDFRMHHQRSDIHFSKLHNILSAESARSIELQRTKYGEVYGAIDTQDDSAVDLQVLRDMMESMLQFCDHKIDKARTLFLDKVKTH